MKTTGWFLGIARVIAILAAALAGTASLPSLAYTLTITPVPAGGYATSSPGGLNCGTGGATCTSSNIPAFTIVTLTAHPDAGCTFAQWSVAGVGTSTENPASFPMPSQNASGSATFRCPPQFTSPATTTFQVGVSGTYTVSASGVPAPTFSLTGGALPFGVTLASNGTLSGTPQGNGGPYTFTVTASNGVSPPASQSFTLVVNQAPTIVLGSDTFALSVGSATGFSMFQATAYPWPTLSLSAGALPTGLSLSTAYDTLNSVTGWILGTPAAGTAGSYAVTVKASNGIGADATQAFVLNVAQAAGKIAPPTANFAGLGNGFTGPSGPFTSPYLPSGANIAVGPNHVVQVVNAGMAIFGKAGTAIAGPMTIRNLWGSNPSPCSARNDGQSIAQYDRLADRWVVTHTAIAPPTTFVICVAVSQGPDPAGAYFLYPLPFTQGIDQPVLAVWPDAYYLAFDAYSNDYTTYQGAKACALDRVRMLAGQPAATPQCFDTSAAYRALLPSDLDGDTPPPAGSPNYLMALGSDPNTLLLWSLHVDWTTPAYSALTGPAILATNAYTLPCAGDTTRCVPQEDTTNLLDSRGDRLAYRLAYRKFDDHEAIVATHAVTAGSSVGMRWYELRSPGATPVIFQQGTHAPDANYRFGGSAAMDWQGNLAMGYSVSSGAMSPQIRYAARLAADPAGTLGQGEATIFAGAGSQASLRNWGHITSMRIDPADDCTFWYTNQYLPADGNFNWRTRIASFRLAGCVPQANITLASSVNPSVYGQQYQITATVAGNAPTGTVTFRLGASTISTEALVGGTAHVHIQSYSVGTFPFTATYSGDAANGGGASPTYSQVVNKANATVAIDYHTPDPSPVLAPISVGATVSVVSPGWGPVTGTVTVSDGTASCTITLPATSCSLTPTTAGAKTITASYAGDTHVNAASVIGVTHTVKPGATIPRLANIATRMQVLTGADVLIGGFIIGGSQAKTVVVRARGPSLTAAGVPGALQNPLLQLFSGATQIAANDDWQQAANADTVLSSGFAPADSRESAILATLTPGAYTAIVSGMGGTTGVGIVEVFEVDLPEVPLINIATRGQVLTVADVMIGGFIIQGDGPQTVIVRARGPSLTALGVPGALQDPVLQLFSGQTQIGVNDDWQADVNAAQILSKGFAPSDSREAAILVTLPPGAYTAIVTGKNGTTGVGIIEVFAQ